MLKARGIAPQHLNQDSVQVKTELSTTVSSAGPGSKRKISDVIKKEEVDDDIDLSLDQEEKVTHTHVLPRSLEVTLF